MVGGRFELVMNAGRRSTLHAARPLRWPRISDALDRWPENVGALETPSSSFSNIKRALPLIPSPTFDLVPRQCTSAFDTNPPSFVTFHVSSVHVSILRASRVLQRSTCRPCARLVRHGHKGAGRTNHKPYANLPSLQRAPPFPAKTWAVFRVGFSQGT